MKLVPQVSWRGRAPLDARLVPLLRAIRSHETLRAAAQALGMSYRSAWDLLAAQARELGAPLVAMERGRGAELSALGARLVAADDVVRRELARLEPKVAVSVGAAERGALRPLRIVASHDPLLAQFCETVAPPVDLSFKGSVECLAALAHGDADVAGFHASGDIGPVIRLLHPRAHRLVRFAVREQGLMLPKGNPKRVRTLQDLSAKRLRFVNRQRGSGTRLLFDELLARDGLRAGDIRGYGTEEFTHLAVAATIAAGRADAGFGVRAAADRFGLHFIRLRRERYWFALRVRDEQNAAMRAFLKTLHGEALGRMAKALPGYETTGAGEIVPVMALSAEEAL